jgi:RimJ/RimL family protein N-acetyltransferase
MNKATDLEPLLEWMNDPEVTQYILTYLPIMREDEEVWFENLKTCGNNRALFAIETHDGNFIGNISAHRIDWRARTASSGTIIGDKNHWGKGYGTDAKMLQLAYVFQTLNLRKITASVLGFNERSARYLMGCGYKQIGVRKKQFFQNGKYCDEILLEVFKQDWLPLWRKYKKKIKS